MARSLETAVFLDLRPSLGVLGIPLGSALGSLETAGIRGKQRKTPFLGVSRSFSREEIVTFGVFGYTLGSRT